VKEFNAILRDENWTQAKPPRQKGKLVEEKKTKNIDLPMIEEGVNSPLYVVKFLPDEIGLLDLIPDLLQRSESELKELGIVPIREKNETTGKFENVYYF
jgi:hypothetical protein